MKQSALQRRTPLARKAMPLRKVALRRRSIARAGQVAAKARPRVSPEERHARKLVQARADGVCEACVTPHPGDEWHHRIRRSQGGRWSAANGLLLCRPVHAWVTMNPNGARMKGWGLKSTEDPTAEAVLYRGAWVLLGDDGSITPTTPPDLPAHLIGAAA